MNRDVVILAESFARWAHRLQFRKYTGELYSVHLAAVADLVESVNHTPEMAAAAWLHDVIEDQAAPPVVLWSLFGPTVRDYVMALTDVSQPSDGNRAARKAKDRAHLAKQCAAVQTIKVADLIDNTRSIVAHDPKFAAVYLKEKRTLLDVLTLADPGLLAQARNQLETA